MGCSTSQATSQPAVQEPVPVRLRTAAALCQQDPRVTEHFREDELRMLGEIVEEWSQERLPGPDAKHRLVDQVLRGESHVSVGLQSSVGAASQAGARGAVSGAAIGHALGRSLSANALALAAPNSNVAASPAGQFATQALGLIGAVAGGLASGVGSALVGGARAGLQSRQIFVFIDRVFLRATKEQAWELAAQHLQLEGDRPTVQTIEETFLAKLQVVLNVPNQTQTGGARQESQTPKALWLRLVQLCLSLEILRQLEAPVVRSPLPAEQFTDLLRLDQEFLRQRVQELAAELVDEMSRKGSGGMTAREIAARCPVESLVEQSADTCPVCLEQFEASAEVRRLPCRHIMHKECCEEWLKTAGTCPTCRHDVRK